MNAIDPGIARPRQRPLAVLEDDCLRPLATKIAASGRLPTVVAIAGGSPGEGVTTTVVNLARTLETCSGLRVLVVDTSLANPRLHEHYGLPHAPGLSDVLYGNAKLKDVVYIAQNMMLGVVPAGSALGLSSSNLYRSDGIPAMLAPLRATGFDIVLIDLPPLVYWPEAISIAAQSDQTFIVISSDTTDRKVACKVRAQLSDGGAPLSGAILNRIRHSL